MARWSVLVLALAACDRRAPTAAGDVPAATAPPPAAPLRTSAVDAAPPLMLARPGCTVAERPAEANPDCATPPTATQPSAPSTATQPGPPTTPFAPVRRGVVHVSPGAWQVSGALGAAVVKRELFRGKAKLVYCYERELARGQAATAGGIDLTFAIDATGAVVTASATGFAPGVAECVASAARSQAFPAAASATIVAVHLAYRLGA